MCQCDEMHYEYIYNLYLVHDNACMDCANVIVYTKKKDERKKRKSAMLVKMICLS